MEQMVTLNLSELYDHTAKIAELDMYLAKVRAVALAGQDVELTGDAPIWLYLKVAHALHCRAKRLYYTSPALGEAGRILIFDHDPF